MTDEIDLMFKEDPSFFKKMSERLIGNSGFSLALRAAYGDELRSFLLQYAMDMHACQSPIEEKFLAALYAVGPAYGKSIEISDVNRSSVEGGALPPNPALYVFPQAKFKLKKDYRVDFLLISNAVNPRTLKSTTVRIIVECDGHAFHERTKEQAAKDKSRDRDLVASGYTVFRFTGSEIHNKAHNCADEVVSFCSRGPK